MTTNNKKENIGQLSSSSPAQLSTVASSANAQEDPA